MWPQIKRGSLRKQTNKQKNPGCGSEGAGKNEVIKSSLRSDNILGPHALVHKGNIDKQAGDLGKQAGIYWYSRAGD